MSEKLLEVFSQESKSLKSRYNSINTVTSWFIFSIILAISLIITWVSQELIYNKSLYYRSYSGTLTNQTIEGILGFQSRFWWSVYLFTPLLLLLKFLFASICINIGSMLSVIDIKFKDIFKSVMLAEGVFVIAQIIFMISLYLDLDNITLQNISGYYPLSSLYFIGVENVNAQWVIYPLQTINLFEALYIAVIAWLLSKQQKFDFVESLGIVLPSYGLGLLLWIVLVAFLTLQIS